MKKLYVGVLSTTLLMVFVLGYYVTKNPIKESYLASPRTFNLTNPLEWISPGTPPAFHSLETSPQVISAEVILSEFFVKRNLTNEEQNALQTWNRLKPLLTQDIVLPNAIEAIKEAGVAWKNLIHVVEEEKLRSDGSSLYRGKGKQCPHFLSKMNVSKLDDNGFKLWVPCGLTQGSSITIIGIPNGLLGNFRIDLNGEPLPGEPDPAIVLHYNVRLHGDKITEDPVIVQNTWTIAHDWGEEERCPLPDDEQNKKVDELDQCNELVGKEGNRSSKSNQHASGPKKISMVHDGIPRKYFPFKQNELFVATFRVGLEGIQMTVDGKHITSFAFREDLESWLISEVRISGDLELISIVASGLPTSEDLEHIIDLEALKAIPLPPRRQLSLIVGVFSNANNFKRRM
ncbi:beta-1,3-galactosyltransferase GALT1-like, partial [Primulina huaijiensis]|uniref:beta-1,3-galactosyltransferase GALT1-like n=1 Tax=Primulina huaijiensis TaxID=1492673 RepID=UPI003CC6FE52